MLAWDRRQAPSRHSEWVGAQSIDQSDALAGRQIWMLIKGLVLVWALMLILPVNQAQAAVGDACLVAQMPGVLDADDVCTPVPAPNLTTGLSCGGTSYFNGAQCVANQASCSATGSKPGTYDSGVCQPIDSPAQGMSCGDDAYYNGSQCVANGSITADVCDGDNVWLNGVCVPPAPSPAPPTDFSAGLSGAASSLSGLKGVVPGTTPGASGQQPICINSAPFVGGGVFVVTGSVLCYGTAADTAGTSIYAYHTKATDNWQNAGQVWDGLNVQDLYARGDITALGTLSVYGGAQLYSPDRQTGVVVANEQVYIGSAKGSNVSALQVTPTSVTSSVTNGSEITSHTIEANGSTLSSASGDDVTAVTVTATGSNTLVTNGTLTTELDVAADGAVLMAKEKDSPNMTGMSMEVGGSSLLSQSATNQAVSTINPNEISSTVQLGHAADPSQYSNTVLATDRITNTVVGSAGSTITQATAGAYSITASGATAAQTAKVDVQADRISLTTGNGNLATNGTTGTTSHLNAGGIQVYESAQTIAAGSTIGDLLQGNTYQNSLHGNTFIDGELFVNGRLAYVSNGAATTTVTSATGASVLDPNGTTSGGTFIVMKGTNDTHAVVDENGRIELQNGVSQHSSAALTLTNGLGNTHGLIVNETQTTLSGGMNSSSMTLDDDGVTFSDSSTGAPIQVHGVADGTADFDAVNHRQLKHIAAGVAGVVAMNNIPAVDPGKTMSLGMGVGNFYGQTAVAVGMSYRKRNAVWRASISTNSSNNYKASTVVGVGAGFSW